MFCNETSLFSGGGVDMWSRLKLNIPGFGAIEAEQLLIEASVA